MNNLIRWLWSHYAFFSARPPPSSNKNFKWMVAIKKSWKFLLASFYTHGNRNWCYVHCTAEIAGSRWPYAQLQYSHAYSHAIDGSCSLSTPFAIYFMFNSQNRSNRQYNSSLLYWMGFCLRFELMNWIETWIKVAAATTAMSTIMMMMMVVVVAVATVQTGNGFVFFCILPSVHQDRNVWIGP